MTKMRTRNQDKSAPSDGSKRVSRKRRASSASDAPPPTIASSSQTSSSQVKRRKRQDGSHDHPEDLRVVDEASEEQVAIGTPQPRQVRFTDAASSQGYKATSTHLTPHIRKTSLVSRRQTISPALLDRHSSQKSSSSRVSLPSSFSLAPDSPASKSFRPLSQVLQERVKSRLRRKRLSEEIREERDAVETHEELIQLREEISELEDSIRQRLYELDVQRQLGEDADEEKTDEIEVELAKLREDLDQKKEKEAALPDLDATDHVDVINDDMMIFDSSQEISYPKLRTEDSSDSVRSIKKPSEAVEVNNAGTQIALPDSASSAERQAFEDAIRYWTREASDAKSTLEILTIELQSLGFGSTECNSDMILCSIRDSFSSIRERLESAVPGSVPSDISNSDLVGLVGDHIESLADRYATQEALLQDGDQLREELVREIQGLIDRLSQAEIRKRQLELGFNELDEQSQKDEILINGLEKQLKEIERNHDMAQALITEKQAKLTSLDSENKNLENTIDKLGNALEGYRMSEVKLQELIERMEVQHKNMVLDMEKNNQQTVDLLQEQLNAETTKRATAEADADDKQVTITSLERRAEMDESTLDSLKQQLAALEEEKAAESEARDLAEGERDQKNTFIAELEVKIEQAEADLDDLQTELGRLRDLKEAEQRQREAAETDLDESNNKITELDQKLLVSGTQANELRQKLYEVQMREKTAIKDLQDAAKQREEVYQKDILQELTRREESDATAAHRNVVIAELTEALRNLEDYMKEELRERDEKITELAARNDQLQSELEETKQELDNALNDLERLQVSSESRIAQLTSDIAALQGSVAEQEATIQTLHAQAETNAMTHSTAITERDEQIADLHHDIFNAQSRIKTLESEKTSLERRVEAEAEQMLALQADRDEQIADLKDTITIKQSEIQNLIEKAQKADNSWQRLMEERDVEMEELRTIGDNNATTIALLIKLNTNLKDKFRRYVRDSTATAQAMKDDMENALLGAATKNGDLAEEGRRVLEEVEALDELSELRTTTTVASSSSGAVLENPTLRKFKSKRTRRQFDSGIGVEEEESSMVLEQ